MEALDDIAFHPAFLSTRIEKERRAVLAEVQMMNTIEYRVDCKLLNQLHWENALGERFPIGLEEQIHKWDGDMLRKFHERWYFPANMTLYVVGDINVTVEQAEKLIEARASPLPVPPPLVLVERRLLPRTQIRRPRDECTSPVACWRPEGLQETFARDCKCRRRLRGTPSNATGWTVRMRVLWSCVDDPQSTNRSLGNEALRIKSVRQAAGDVCPPPPDTRCRRVEMAASQLACQCAVLNRGVPSTPTSCRPFAARLLRECKPQNRIAQLLRFGGRRC